MINEVTYKMNKVSEVIERLEVTDKIFSVLFSNESIELYIAGGLGCLLSGASVRPTTDFDFVEQDYPAKYLRVLNTLGDFDFIDISVSPIAPDFKKRSTQFYKGNSITGFYLSPEDIIVMKINRYNDIDKDDILKLLKISDRHLLLEMIHKAIDNISNPYSKEQYISKANMFKKEVLNHV